MVGKATNQPRSASTDFNERANRLGERLVGEREWTASARHVTRWLDDSMHPGDGSERTLREPVRGKPDSCVSFQVTA